MARRRALVVASLAFLGACGGAARVGVAPSSTRTSPTTPPPSRTTVVASTTSGGATTTSATTTPPPPASTSTLPAGPARRVYAGDPGRRAVALTFDAGSDTGSTAQILDILRSEHVTATFSITGRWAEANPELVRRIVAGGHQLMNHSYDHRSFTGASTSTAPLGFAERSNELRLTEATVARIAGVRLAPWFRPPYGDVDTSVDTDLGRVGYRYDVLWTVDSLGWQGLPAAAIVQRCLSRAAPGAIYLFHVGSASRDAAALAAVIDGLRRAGYRFASVAQILAA